MAKKRKLNKQVVIVLSVAGVFVLLCISAAIIWAMPKDFKALMAKGDQAYKAKEFAAADKLYGEALGTARKANNKDTPEMYMKRAELLMEWRKSTVLSQAERSQKYGAARDCYVTALRIQRDNLECQRALTEMVWTYEVAGGQRWPEFVKQADALLALDDKDAVTYFRRAIANSELARNMGDTYVKPALADYRKALELKGDEPEFWTSYAIFLLRKVDAQQAEEAFRKALEAMPGKAVLHVAYANFLAGAKDQLFSASQPGQPRELQKEARAQYEKAIEVEPANVEGYLSYAGYFLARGDMTSAAEKLEKAKSADPTDHRPYFQLAGIAVRQSKPAQAMETLKEGIKAIAPRPTTQPRAEEAEQRRVEFGRAQLNLQLATLLLDQTEGKGLEERKPLIEEAKSLRDRMAPLGKAATDLIDGRIAFAEGRFDEARRMLEFAYENGPFDPQTAFLLVQTYMVMGMPGKVDPIVKKFEDTPGWEANPLPQIIRAQVLMQVHRYEEALKEANRALAKQKDNPIALKMKDDLEALLKGALKPGMTLAPERVPQFLERANGLWAEDRKDEAIKMVQDMHARLGGDLRVINQLVTFYVAQKEKAKAKELVLQALEKDKDNPALKRVIGVLDEDKPEKQLEMLTLQCQEIKDPLARAMALARLYATFGKMEEYRKQLEEAAAANPKSLGVIEMQFRLALSGTNPNWAVANECVKRAAAADPSMGKLYGARASMVKGDFSAAAAVIGELLREHGENKQLRVMLGDCYLNMNDPAKAKLEYKQVADADFGFTPAILGMARTTALLNEWQDHARYVEQAYNLAPQDPYVKTEHLRIQVDKLKPAEAIRQLEAWRKDNPKDVQNLMRLAAMYERNREPDKAEELYRLVYEQANDKVQTARWLISFYLRANRWKEIEAVLNQLTDEKFCPDRVGVYVVTGDVRMLQGTKESLKLAQDAYQMAIDKDKDNPRGYQAMATFLAARGRYAEAIDAQKAYLAHEPGPAGEKALARMLILAGQLDEARLRLEKVLDGVPTDPEALSDLAVVLTRQNKMKEALGQLDKAVAGNPALADPLLRRASLLIALGETERAREDLKALHRNAPTADTLQQVALQYMRIRDEESAESMYTEALVLQEDHGPAIMELARLYLAKGKWDRLEPLLDRAKKLFPKALDFPRIRGEEWKRRNDPVKRAQALEEAYGISQEKPVVAEYVSALLEAGLPDKAQEVIQKEAAHGGAWLEALRARALAQSKKAVEAESLFKACLKDAAPEDIAFVLDQAGKAYGPREGMTVLEGWLSVRPNDWLVVRKLAEMHSQAQGGAGLKKSRDLLLQALALAQRPEDKAEVQFALGTVYHQIAQRDQSAADLDKAEQHYVAAAKVLQGNFGCLNNLAYLYTDSKHEPAKALPFTEQAFKLAPNSSDVLDTYGWTLYQLGQVDKAELTLVQALQSEHPAPVVRYHLGFLYEKKRELDKARMQYQLGWVQFNDDERQDEVYKQLKAGLDRVQAELKK